MRFTVTATQEHHLRSESVMSARQGMDVVDDLRAAGFTIVLVLDRARQAISIAELRSLAEVEPVAHQDSVDFDTGVTPAAPQRS